MGMFDRFFKPKEEKTNTNLHNNDERSTITIFTNGNNVRLKPQGMTRINTPNGEKPYIHTQWKTLIWIAQF